MVPKNCEFEICTVAPNPAWTTVLLLLNATAEILTTAADGTGFHRKFRTILHRDTSSETVGAVDREAAQGNLDVRSIDVHSCLTAGNEDTGIDTGGRDDRYRLRDRHGAVARRVQHDHLAAVDGLRDGGSERTTR